MKITDWIYKNAVNIAKGCLIVWLLAAIYFLWLVINYLSPGFLTEQCVRCCP